MRCEKCEFDYDSEDAFCRKCGAALSQNETEFASSAPAQFETTTTAVELIPAAPLTIAKPGRFRWLSRALNSKPGKKVVRSAALVAVGVGLELIAQTLGKRQKGAITRPAGATQLQMPFEQPSNSRTTVIQTVTTQRTYTRTIIRRTK